MDLQTAFYIVGIIFMGIMLLLVIGLLVVVLVIKSKIDHVHRMVTDKVNTVKGVTDKLTTVLATLRHFVNR